MEFDKVIKERTAVRKFKDVVVSDDKINKILEIKPDAIPPTLDGGLRKSLM